MTLHDPLIFACYCQKAMSQIDSSLVHSYCADISAGIHRAFPHLTPHFLIYQNGERAEKIARLLPHIARHAAHDGAAAILKFRTTAKEQSAFLGIADGLEKVHLRFKKEQKKSLAFIALNISQYTSIDDVFMAAHFFTGQMFCQLLLHTTAEYSFKEDWVRSCRDNMIADIYSVLQLSREGQYDSVHRLSHQRSIETLTPQSTINPEFYPFPLTLDVVSYTIENQIPSKLTDRGTSPAVGLFQLSRQIAACFEIENLQSWKEFSSAAQTMAWGGFSAGQILGAAVHTSTNPFIKAIGHLLAELTNLSPIAAEHLPNLCNPFVADEINKIAHDHLVEDNFEMALIHAEEADSALPFLRVADNQNEALLKGRPQGWCANALQAAARAYTNAVHNGVPPAQAARLEFQSAQTHINWHSIIHLKHHVIAALRSGHTPEFLDILTQYQDTPDFRFITDSIEQTLQNPKYKDKARPLTDSPFLS